MDRFVFHGLTHICLEGEKEAWSPTIANTIKLCILGLYLTFSVSQDEFINSFYFVERSHEQGEHSERDSWLIEVYTYLNKNKAIYVRKRKEEVGLRLRLLCNGRSNKQCRSSHRRHSHPSYQGRRGRGRKLLDKRSLMWCQGGLHLLQCRVGPWGRCGCFVQKAAVCGVCRGHLGHHSAQTCQLCVLLSQLALAIGAKGLNRFVMNVWSHGRNAIFDQTLNMCIAWQ